MWTKDKDGNQISLTASMISEELLKFLQNPDGNETYLAEEDAIVFCIHNGDIEAAEKILKDIVLNPDSDIWHVD